MDVAQGAEKTTKASLTFLRDHFNLGVAFGQEDPLISQSGPFILVYIWINDKRFLFPKDTACEITVFASPDGFLSKHSRLNDLRLKTLAPVFSDRPGAFTEAPVVVTFAGATY